MNYAYYNQAPSWGTQSYQLGKPPTPRYQPQPSWGGMDYYRAHTGWNDDSTFADVWGRMPTLGSTGTGKSEARYWHRQIYGGVVDARSALPNDLGSAAAYEAWRSWKYHYGVYGQPIGSDRERQREALVGIAVGEAARLWGYTGRTNDAYGRNDAIQSAAATANRISIETWDLDEMDGSIPSGSPYRSRSRSRTRTRSFNGGVSPYTGTPYTGTAVGSGGFVQPVTVSPSMSGMIPQAASGYGGMGHSPSGYAPPYTTPSVSAGQPYGSYPGNGYASSSPGYMPQPTYGDAAYGYSGSASALSTSYTSPNDVVIHVPRRSRRHSHSGKHHRHRSHSPNPGAYQYDDGYSSGRTHGHHGYRY